MLERELLDQLRSKQVKSYDLERVLYKEGCSKKEWSDAQLLARRVRRKHYEELVRDPNGLPKSWEIGELERNYVLEKGIEGCAIVGKPLIENGIGGEFAYVGPLLVEGLYAKGEFYPVLNVGETALNRAINAGLKYTKELGGIKTRVQHKGMSRSVLFRVGSLEEIGDFEDYLRDKKRELEDIMNKTTKYGRFRDMTIRSIGRDVHVRFVMDTGEAMGMNMVSIAAQQAAEKIIKEYNFQVDLVTISGNTCMDKKIGAINCILGRGDMVDAEVEIPLHWLDSYMQIVDPRMGWQDFFNYLISKNYVGSALAGGAPGSQNTHAANMILAMQSAYGQDCAQIESASAVKTLNLDDKRIVYGIQLPSLEVGTVGGATERYPAYKFLQAIGCRDPDNVPYTNSACKLAEIVAGVTLAGELSTDLALVTGRLVRIHKEGTRR